MALSHSGNKAQSDQFIKTYYDQWENYKDTDFNWMSPGGHSSRFQNHPMRTFITDTKDCKALNH